jgi:hypothetical protein
MKVKAACEILPEESIKSSVCHQNSYNFSHLHQVISKENTNFLQDDTITKTENWNLELPPT